MATRKKRSSVRPSKYDRDLATEFCLRMIEGRSVKDITDNDTDMPHRKQIYRWLAANEEFRQMYESAQRDSMRVHADSLIEIADDISGDPQRDRLRVDARKWVLARMLPKQYGDRVQQEVSGPDGGPIETDNTFVIEFVDAKVTDE